MQQKLAGVEAELATATRDLRDTLDALTREKDAIQGELVTAQARMQALEQGAAQFEPRLIQELRVQEARLAEAYDQKAQALKEAHQEALKVAEKTGASDKAAEMERVIRELQDKHRQELALLRVVQDLLTGDSQKLTKESKTKLPSEAHKLHDALVLSRELLKIANAPADDLAKASFTVAKVGGNEPATLLTRIRGLLTDLDGQRQEAEKQKAERVRQEKRAVQAEKALDAARKERDEETARADAAEAELVKVRQELELSKARAAEANHVATDE